MTTDSILIFGNGPSLLGMEGLVRRAAAEMDTFACNRAVRWSGLNWQPTYYACSANAILKGIEPAEPPAAKSKFLVSRRHDELAQLPDTWTKVYKKEWFEPLRPGDAALQVKGGATMPGIMLQLAAWLGYRACYLVGIEQRGNGHSFDAEGRDLHYFIPDEERLFNTWRLLKETYEGLGITVRDCTPGGRLNEMLGYFPLEEALKAPAWS